MSKRTMITKDVKKASVRDFYNDILKDGKSYTIIRCGEFVKATNVSCIWVSICDGMEVKVYDKKGDWACSWFFDGDDMITYSEVV